MCHVPRWFWRLTILLVSMAVTRGGIIPSRAEAQVCTQGAINMYAVADQQNTFTGCTQFSSPPLNSTADSARWKVVGAGVRGWVKHFSCLASGNVTTCSVSPTKDSSTSVDTVTVSVAYSTGSTGAGGTVTLNAVDDSGDAISGILTDSTPYTTITNFTNATDQDMARCSVSCFAVTASSSTPAYYSLGKPRSVTLDYNGDRARPRPFIYADVQTHIGTAPTKYQLQVTTSAGAKIPFTNGDSVLNFTGATGTHRLAGQLVLDSTIATGPLPVTVTTSAIYSTGTISQSTNLSLAVVNERNSPIAHGWSLAKVQRLYVQAATGSILMAEGNGSAEVFTGCGSGVCVSPAGEYSMLWYSPGSLPATTYTRKYPDSSQAVFNSVGQEIERIDSYGNADSLAYDGQGRLIAVYDPVRTRSGGGRAYTELTYNTYGLATIVSPGANGTFTGGRTTTVTVNASDSTLGEIADPDGHATMFGYDAHKRLSWERDRRGDTTKFGYDTLSWKMTSTSSPPVPVDSGNGMIKASLYSLTTTYQPWQLVGVPTAPTGTTPATPALPSMHGTITDPAGHVTTIAVNRWGQADSVVNALGAVMQVSLADSNPIPQIVTSPQGGSTQITFSASTILSVQPASGSAVNMLYHSGYGEPDSIFGGGAPSQRLFIGTGGRIDSIRVDGHVIVGMTDTVRMMRYTYDSRGRTLSAQDIGGHTTHYHYDAVFGNLDSVQAVGNRVTVVRYDQYGRDSATWNNSTPHRSTIYDVMNRVTSLYDGVNVSPTAYSYDALFAVRVQDPKNQVFLSTTDALGRPSSLHDAGDTTKYTSYRYNVDGLLTSITNRRSQLTNVTYDSAHRVLTNQRLVSGVVVAADSFAYDVNGLRTVEWNNAERDSIFTATSGWVDSVVTILSNVNQRYRVWYEPDSALRVSYATITTKTISGITLFPAVFTPRSYTYDNYTGLLTTVTLNNSTKYQTHFTYNTELNLVSTQYPGTGTSPLPGPLAESLISDHAPYQVQFSSSVLDNPINQKFGYDSLGRLNTTIPVNTAQNKWQITQYDYDGLGRLAATRLNDSTGLCAADTTSGYQCGTEARQDTLEYDAVGNLTGGTMAGITVGAGYRNGNRDTTLRAVTHTFDLDGNVTANGSRQFYWGVEGHLDSVVAGTTTLSYQYYANGFLAKRLRNGALDRIFLWDGSQLLAELDSSGTVVYGEYVSMGTDAPFAYIKNSGSGISASYHMTDAAGNAFALIRSDSGGVQSVREQYVYDEYGAQSLSVDSGYTNRMTWKGMVYEGDSTRLYYARARWYDPQQGRFMSEDPTGLGGGINQYVFGGDDHINNADPSGSDMCEQIDADFGPDYDPLCQQIMPNASDFGNCGGTTAECIAQYVGTDTSADTTNLPATAQTAQTTDTVQTLLFGTHWCGPGGGGWPVNELDSACQAHDRCYDANGLTIGDNSNPFLAPGKSAALFNCNESLCIAASHPRPFIQGGAAVILYFTLTPLNRGACIANMPFVS
jgi:RHS repeat-associated protein